MSEVTVIIPNYNGLQFMKPCMEALRAQTYTDFCVLILDNGSSDGSVEYLRALMRDEPTDTISAKASIGPASPGSASTSPAPTDPASISPAPTDPASISSAPTDPAETESVEAAPAEANTAVYEKVTAREEASGSFALKDGSTVPIRTIFLPDNLGFTGAVNVCIEASDTPYLILLNNDTEAAPGYIGALVEVLKQDTEHRVFSVSPKMVQLYHKDLLDDAGDGYCILGWSFQRGVDQSVDAPKFNRRTAVFSACAGAAIYRKDVLEEIRFADGSYFDPMHFAYLEDLDVGFRARVLGFENIYTPDAVVYHVGSGTQGAKYSNFKVRLAARNNVYLNVKNMPLLMLLVNLPFILLGVLIKQLFFIKKGFGKAFLSGFLEGLATIGRCRVHKTRFVWRRLPAYLSIELGLIKDMFSYTRDYLKRKL